MLHPPPHRWPQTCASSDDLCPAQGFLTHEILPYFYKEESIGFFSVHKARFAGLMRTAGIARLQFMPVKRKPKFTHFTTWRMRRNPRLHLTHFCIINRIFYIVNAISAQKHCLPTYFLTFNIKLKTDRNNWKLLSQRCSWYDLWCHFAVNKQPLLL